MIAALRVRRARTRTAAAVIAVLATFGVMAQQPHPADVTAQHLLDGFKDPARWLMYSGDYSGARHSPLQQISPANVHRPAW